VNFWKNRRTLIAGGAGFIGSYLVEQLVADGAQVTVVDNLEKGSLDNLQSVMDDICFLNKDLRDRDVCEAVCKGSEVVLNLAARAYGVEYSNVHHGEMLTSNLLLGLNLLEAARQADVERYLIVSTSCVYPDDAEVPTPEYDTFVRFPEEANQGYGWAKRILELQGRYYANEYGMNIAIVRLFNAYGPRDVCSDSKSHVIPALINKILNDSNEICVWGSGRQRRSFVHGRDVAAAMKRIIEQSPSPDPINIGHEGEISIRDLVFRLMKLLNSTKRVIFDLSKPEGAQRKSADMTKLREIVGPDWPTVSFDDGLREIVECQLMGINKGDRSRIAP